VFNPNIQWACKLLPEGHKLKARWAKHLQSMVMYP
jgi:hypothetical protein